MIGGDTQVAAISAAISLGDRFMVEGSGVQPIRVCLERNAQCFKGSIQLAGRKKPLRHLIALSDEFSSSNISAGSGRTLLASSENGFIWASIAHIHGIPGMPKWGDWFAGELETHHALTHALGIGCDPVIVDSELNSERHEDADQRDRSPNRSRDDWHLKLRERVDLGPQRRYRLVGVGLSNFREPEGSAAQPVLFE